MHFYEDKRVKRRQIILVWFAAVFMILAAHIGSGVVLSNFSLSNESPFLRGRSLGSFPKRVGNWSGKDIRFADKIDPVAGIDDYVNRLYVNDSANLWATVFVSYSNRPRTILGHRPRVCYVAAGWVHDGTEQVRIVSAGGAVVPCLIHRFHRPAPQSQGIVVVNFYVLNGELRADEGGFLTLSWRTPNMAGSPSRYVAQIQISSAYENSVLAAAKDMIEQILEFFPSVITHPSED